MLRQRLGFTAVEVMMVFAMGSVLVPVSMTKYERMRGRSRQAEVKTNLRAIYAGQQTFYAARNAYSTSTKEIGFSPARGNRYKYDLGARSTPSFDTSTAGLADACADFRSRASAVEGPGTCGVGADTFVHGLDIIPKRASYRSSVQWIAPTGSLGRVSMARDSTGVNQLLAQCPNCDFAAHAYGNIDDEDGGDEWFIGSQQATMPATSCAVGLLRPAGRGMPLNVRDDVVCD